MPDSTKKIRVRFAPSPTGHLHVGGARTALYNWLFARGSGGSFILRIEDTDLSRSTDENIQQIISSMKWLGLDWDEGPEAGGGFGPYRQMERTQLYEEATRQLLESGAAYHCYCTPAQIEEERLQAREAGKAYIYSGRCRSLSEDDTAALEAAGIQPVIRLKAPDQGITVVNDLIRGEVTFDNALVGDIILVRSSGIPTYNFAVAIDDAQMEISHVIRGDDHLPNTPKQLLVLRALGKEPPIYAHLPLILGPDRAPLSKRHGSASLEEFRAQGFVREALCNFLALLGWSYDAETTLFSVDELVQRFSLDRVGNNAAVFDNDKLLWMNGQHIRGMDPAVLADRIEEFIQQTPISGLPGTGGNPTVADLVLLVQEKIKTLAEFTEMTDFFFQPVIFQEKALTNLQKDENAPAVLAAAATIIAEVQPFTTDSLEEKLRATAEEMEIKLGKFLQPIRIAVSGKNITPGMFETLTVLGREKSLERISAAAAKIT